jgi:hypothetical protein
MAIRLYIKDTSTLLGEITVEQRQMLVDLLEEEDDDDQDYYIDENTLAYLEEEEVDPALLELIRPHVKDEDGVEIEWKEED